MKWQPRFKFERKVIPDRPDYFAIVPISYEDGTTGVISYRRTITLQIWCREQFGHEHTVITTQAIIFRTEAEMVLFVALWSGISIDAATTEQLEAEDKREGQAAERLGLEY